MLGAKEGQLTDGLDNGAGDQGMMFGYACQRSTLVGSLPEKAPPPWGAVPP